MAEDWIDRWENGRTGWHENDGNAGLKSHWPADVDAPRILVPMCGKSPDLLWLVDRGHEVVGVELAEIAVREFFSDHDLTFQILKGEHLDCYSADDLPISIYCGDYFRFDSRPFDALYDRGALVALPESLRPKYVEQTRQLLRPGAVRLIITLEYDQSVVQGPPYSVLPAEIGTYWNDLSRVAEIDDMKTCPPKFRQAGLKEIQEVVWLASGESASR